MTNNQGVNAASNSNTPVSGNTSVPPTNSEEQRRGGPHGSDQGSQIDRERKRLLAAQISKLLPELDPNDEEYMNLMGGRTSSMTERRRQDGRRISNISVSENLRPCYEHTESRLDTN